ncbi:hypothetical protein [Candidatus Chloroploca asiatica]|uniref:Uncharacterized protein n=1 Tax=Candidatus Chloroploca asiatica TaxID=1506545 RepID=A0A2H3KGN7_9CHLR|nr:hypothetical protein [Candidatus Chloroploca asiatica]PDV96883.1 hypothetical protein A9Q02_19955 [Candidatus Chloroploca asiatica]
MGKITYEQLVDLAEGRLADDQAITLRQIVAADPDAQRELASLEELIGLMRSDRSVDAPAYVFARALRLMRPPTPAAQEGIVQRILAVLRGDSQQLPLAAGLRTGQTVRSLVYHADAWDLDLQVTRQNGRWQIQGQLLGPELNGVVQLEGGVDAVTATINELGEFSLPPVGNGVYTLRIQVDGHEIVVSPLELTS